MWYTLGHSFGARHEHYWHSNICLSCIHLFAVIAFPQHLCMQARPGRCCVRLRVIFTQDQNVYGTCTRPPRKLYIYAPHNNTRLVVRHERKILLATSTESHYHIHHHTSHPKCVPCTSLSISTLSTWPHLHYNV